MSEAISFWLDNKMASALKVAEIGDQALVEYRSRYYVVRNGSALMRGSKPLRYSNSSMPSIWKKAMRGEAPAVETQDAPDEEIMPMTSMTKRMRPKKDKGNSAMPDTTPETSLQSSTPVVPAKEPKSFRPIKKPDIKTATQSAVPAQCPYCSQRQEIPAERGKNGKPFFFTCSRCAADFAVRFVPVTMLQAQVAGFR